MTNSWKSKKSLYLCKVNQPIMSEDKINAFEANQDRLISIVETLSKTVITLIKVVDENFTDVKAKIDVLESKIDALDGTTEQGFKEVKWELKKIQDVTQYADIHANFPATGQA